MVQAQLTGPFPRSEALVQATRAAARSKMPSSDLEEAYRRDLAALGKLQMESGLNYFVDGQLNWADIFRPFSEIFKGIKLGALTRWFDNNTFYRKPVVVGKITVTDTGLDRYFRGNLLPQPAPRKAILPGPFTFATMSQNVAYPSFGDLVDDLAHGLRETATRLRHLGYEYFQFDEPSLCTYQRTETEMDDARHALEICTKGINARTAVHTYFGDASPIIDSLLDFETDCIGVDFYATSLEDLHDHTFDKELVCGCVDGRNSLLESVDDIGRFVEDARERLEPKSVSISPNSDLSFLPQPIAEKKVWLLSDIKRKMEI